MADKVGHVYKSLEAVQTALAQQGISKDGKNSGQGFKFRGIDQVLNTLSGLLAANRVLCVLRSSESIAGYDSTRTIEDRKTSSGKPMATTLLTRDLVAVSLVDGSELNLGTYSGEGMDSNDKATSKAHSMLYKYAMFLAFCIPLEGVLDDGDASDPVDEAEKAPSKPAKASKVSKATKAAPKDEEPSEEPTEAAKGSDEADEEEAEKSEDKLTVAAAIKKVKATKTLKDCETLALTLRSLRADADFGKLKDAVKTQMAKLKEAA